MRLVTVATDDGTRAARIDGQELVLLQATDVGGLLADPEWRPRASASGVRVAIGKARLTNLIPRPSKIFCVGLNYRHHVEEIGLPEPEHPTLFGKFSEALIGPYDPVQLPSLSDQVDWEAELAIVIGRAVRHADPAAAASAIAGFTVANDVSMRDLQERTPQWLQGKTFEGTTPVGPCLVTPDELAGGVEPDLEISCAVNGETMQRSRTSDLIFGCVELVQYISQIITLRPGDLILTGTPGGVGVARRPARFLAVGDTLTTEIEGIGRLENRLTAAEKPVSLAEQAP